MEISITYEKLFEILMKEKKSNELQELNKEFFNELVSYFNEKVNLLKNQKEKLDVFSFKEEENLNKQIINIKKMIKSLYEKREEKLIKLALDCLKTEKKILNKSNMLKEEEKFFEEIIQLMENYRKDVLNKLLKGELPSMIEPKEIKVNKKENAKRLVRFDKDVPEFVGIDSKIYGPFKKETIANLSSEIAELLIKNGSVEEIKIENEDTKPDKEVLS